MSITAVTLSLIYARRQAARIPAASSQFSGGSKESEVNYLTPPERAEKDAVNPGNLESQSPREQCR